MLALHSEERIWLDEYRQALIEQRPGAVVRMLVYGSKARGDAHEDSDIDVLLVLRNEAEQLKRPLRPIGYDLAATSSAVPSIVAYTQAEWERLRDLRSTKSDQLQHLGSPAPWVSCLETRRLRCPVPAGS